MEKQAQLCRAGPFQTFGGAGLWLTSSFPPKLTYQVIVIYNKNLWLWGECITYVAHLKGFLGLKMVFFGRRFNSLFKGNTAFRQEEPLIGFKKGFSNPRLLKKDYPSLPPSLI